MRTTEKIDLTEPYWERQKSETTHQFNLFMRYKEEKLELFGNMATLSKKMGRGSSFTKQLQKYSCRFRWTERINAYLDYLNRVEVDENEKARRNMVRRQAENGVAFQAKAMEILPTLSPNNVDADDVCRIIEVGTKLERTARGMPSDIVATTDIKQPESREERLARLKKELGDL